jgi:Ceramidase
MTGLLGTIGGSDCELIHRGVIAQPFNTWSSLAYVVAGALVIVRRQPWHLDRSAVVFGGLVIAVGAGSVAYHAAANAPGRWLHDTSLLAALAFIAGYEVGLWLRRDAGRAATAAAAVVLVVMGVVLIPVPDATNVGVALLVLVASSAYVAQRIRELGDLGWRDVPFVALSLVAAVAFFLGRTGSVACRPASWFQFHGLWHIGTAILAVVWATTSLSASAGAPTQRAVARE